MIITDDGVSLAGYQAMLCAGWGSVARLAKTRLFTDRCPIAGILLDSVLNNKQTNDESDFKST